MPRINLNQIQIGSEITHNGNVLKVTSITDNHTYKGAWIAKTAVCSCSIKTERGTQVTAFVPFILKPDGNYMASDEYSKKIELYGDECLVPLNSQFYKQHHK